MTDIEKKILQAKHRLEETEARGRVKETPIIYIIKHRELSRRIAEITEELEELRSEKKRLLVSLSYADNAGLSELKSSISAIETNLKKLEKQEQKYNAELESALNEYKELQEQAEEFNPDELISTRIDLRPERINLLGTEKIIRTWKGGNSHVKYKKNRTNSPL